MIFRRAQGDPAPVRLSACRTMKALAKKIDVPLYRLHGVASFYPHFRLTPPPKADVRVCQDMSCHLRGARALARGTRRIISAFRSRRTSKISGVSCLGRCDQAPAVAINDRIYTGLRRIADHGNGGRRACAAARCRSFRMYTARRAVRLRSVSATASVMPLCGASLQSRDWDAAFATLKAPDCAAWAAPDSPPNRNGRWCARRRRRKNTSSATRTKANPARFKDRFILTHLPHLVIEGMILAGLMTGAQKGILYIRHEYEEQEKILHDEIARCRREGLLGPQHSGQRIRLRAGDFRQPRRIYLRRRKRAAGSDRRQARRAAQQAAVSRAAGPVEQAHGHQQRRDVRQRPANSAPRRGLVQSAGR